MRWLPKRRSSTWWWIALAIAAVSLIVIVFGIRALLPSADPKYPQLILVCLAIGLIIGTSGWFGARWFPPIATLGLTVGLIMMLTNLSGRGDWSDLIGILNFMIFLVGGFALGVIVELVIWLYRWGKNRRP